MRRPKMAKIVAMLLISIADAVFLVLFVRWSMQQEKRMSSILEEYKEIQKSTESYILSVENKKRLDEFDAYFEKVFKTLDESKEHVANRSSDG